MHPATLNSSLSPTPGPDPEPSPNPSPNPNPNPNPSPNPNQVDPAKLLAAMRVAQEQRAEMAAVDSPSP